MRTRDIMSSPVVTATPGMHLKAAAELLVERRVSALPVVEGGVLVGIVTEADLVPLEAVADPRAHALRQAAEPTDAPRTVAEVMTREVLSLPEDADAAEAARLMLQRGVRAIPIVAGTRVTGIVARRDLLKILARHDDDVRREVEALLADEVPFRHYVVDVHDGIVTLSGPAAPAGPGSRQLPELLARTVPGVVAVRFSAPAP